MQRVTDNVCTDTTLRGCNPSYVTTSDGVVVIDTPQLPTKAVAMRREAESHGPIRYLVNTEHHVDHIFGNYFFKGAGTVINHQALYDRFMVVMPDLDFFTRPNDTQGHEAGDRALRLFADTARGVVRDRDHGGRGGGEELAQLLPGANAARAAGGPSVRRPAVPLPWGF